MIRLAVISDAMALGRLHIDSWQASYRGTFPDEFLDGLDLEARIDWFRQSIEDGAQLLVAEVDQVISGFAFFGRSPSNDWGELYAIYVHPGSWGAGHGFRLIRESELGLSDLGFERALLWVIDSNARARRFYERQGWVLASSVKLEEIGGVQVTEVRYEKDLRESI